MKPYDESNPIYAAVAPLKNEAVQKAAKYADEVVITSVLANLVKHDMDLTKAAPYPEPTMRRAQYIAAKMKHDLYRRLTNANADDARMKALKPWEVGRRGSPDIRTRSLEAEAAYIDAAKRDAAAQYDAFVAKLVLKCGQCDRASLKGNHVWGYSFLTVERFDAASNTLTREVWKTQQIVNVSKLGKVFNQWPTRKVKT